MARLWTFSEPFKIHELNDQGHFTGIGSIYGNVAEAFTNNVLLPGAFTRTVQHWQQAGRNVPFLHYHDPSQVLGSLKVGESSRGLEIVDGVFDLNTQAGREKYSLAKNGHMTGLSIGFMDVPSKTEIKQENGKVIHYMKEVKLHEVSLVTFPADASAQIERVQSATSEKDAWITAKVEKLVAEGKDSAQAVAIANSMWDEMHNQSANFWESQDVLIKRIEFLQSFIVIPDPDQTTQEQSAPDPYAVTAMEKMLETLLKFQEK